ERLRLSNAETERLASMAQAWWRLLAAFADERALRALLYRLGEQRFVDRMMLAWSRTPADASDPVWHRAVTLPQRWQPPTFPLKAADLMVRGVTRGPALGRALAAAEEAWVAADFPREASTLAAIADAAIGSKP